MTQAFPAGLTSVQAQVVFSLASGSSITNAATNAGVGRSTIHHWITNQPAFAQLVEEAKAAYVLTLRDQLRDASAKALATLTSILDDPEAPASVRLKAALAILNRPQFPDRSWCLPEKIEDPAKEQFLDTMDELKANRLAQDVINHAGETDLDKSEHISEISNPSSQSGTLDDAEQQPADSTRQTVSSVKVGRNTLCPCHSGKKFKHCCINRTH